MTYELYRLDKPDEVAYEVKADTPRIAFVFASIQARNDGDVFMFSQKLLTAVSSKGALGVRVKGQEPTKLPPARRAMDDFDDAPIRARRRKEAVPA